ncbi:4'-phosphopantetheinyl transferase family protein [Candidatus Coxiella mudrowiae]|uniref:4'-phosphopantetheinyl transferase family protein n=1 Tax=Candidatus Coxiella mudrowiae TaxID=2054173 RepID=UPI000C284486|nr:4'-phosphopantetheinyl transferase superfamily protein [Candidatus Coxiella mudrowiae]
MNKDDPWETVTRPSLKEGEVHVWRVFLDWPDEEVKKGLVNLSMEEKARIQRLVNSQHRRYYIASHSALHAILALYLPTPGTLRFRYDDYGKPYLLNDASLYFNLSDSHTVALYAITTNREVGVDIESIRSNIHTEDIAERFFSPDEIAAFRRLPQNQHLEGFFRIWTLKEAYIKIIGQGLSFGLNRFTTNVNVDAVKMDGLLTVDEDPNLARQWTLCSIPSAPGYMASLATEGPIKKIRYFAWSLTAKQ